MTAGKPTSWASPASSACAGSWPAGCGSARRWSASRRGSSLSLPSMPNSTFSQERKWSPATSMATCRWDREIASSWCEGLLLFDRCCSDGGTAAVWRAVDVRATTGCETMAQFVHHHHRHHFVLIPYGVGQNSTVCYELFTEIRTVEWERLFLMLIILI